MIVFFRPPPKNQSTENRNSIKKACFWSKKLWIFDAKKQKAASKKKQKRQQIKEIKFRPVTEKNDYEIKVNKIKSFIENGDKAKITLRFRGREMAHQQIGMELLKRVETDLESMASVEQFPTLEGRQLVMMMAPNKKN